MWNTNSSLKEYYRKSNSVENATKTLFFKDTTNQKFKNVSIDYMKANRDLEKYQN